MSSALALLQVIIKPHLLVPKIRVESIRQLDFGALKRAGYRGAVFDKDNCLTVPNDDRLVPQLQEAWNECREAFGPGNVVIVSNAAGTSKDPGGIEAEAVTQNLHVPVLLHDVKKPGCSSTVMNYYNSLSIPSPPSLSQHSAPTASGFNAILNEYPSNPDVQAPHHRPIKPSELIVVGDRLLTDVVLANTLGALPILTTKLWRTYDEALLLRPLERGVLRILDRFSPASGIAQLQFVKQQPVAISTTLITETLGTARETWNAARTSTLFIRDRLRDAYRAALEPPFTAAGLSSSTTPETLSTRGFGVALRSARFVGRFTWALTTDISVRGWRMMIVRCKMTENLGKIMSATRGIGSTVARFVQRG